MEYDSPLFIAAVKKILRDGIAHFANSFNDLKDSVSAHWKADEERYQTKPVSVTDLRADVPIRVQTEPKRSKPENAWRYIIGTLEAIAFIAITVYTIVAYNQWQAMRRANDVSMSNFRRARIDANEQQKLGIIAANAAKSAADNSASAFHADQRAWIMTTFSSNETAHVVDGRLQEPLHFVNMGKTPALNIFGVFFVNIFPANKLPDFKSAELTLSQFAAGTIKVGTKSTVDSTGMDVGTFFPNTPRDIIARGAHVTPAQMAKYPAQAYIAFYGIIAYKDVFQHRHWIHFCSFECANVAESLKDPRVKCAEYNGVDNDVE